MKIGALIAPIVVSLGMFMLLLDLGYKLHVFRFYMDFNLKSAMSWGAWILVFIYPANALFLAAVWELPENRRLDFLRNRLSPLFSWAQKNAKGIAKINLVLGIALGIYTGVLLSTFVAMHLWNSGLLGPLFLLSGVSSAAALMVLIEKSSEARHALANVDRYLILAELLMITLLLIDLLSGCMMNKCAARFLISADFSVFFWVFVVGLGLVLPLVIEWLAEKTDSHKASWVAPVMVLCGGLALRFLFVVVGQAVTCIQKGIL